jgi:hypothetical protein
MSKKYTYYYYIVTIYYNVYFIVSSDKIFNQLKAIIKKTIMVIDTTNTVNRKITDCDDCDKE